jgi:hypothetical protein
VVPLVVKLWILMTVGAACFAAGLGFVVAGAWASGAIGSAATTLALIALAGMRSWWRGRQPARQT